MSQLDDVAAAAKTLPWVEARLLKMRAPLRERTVFTPAGRTVLHSNGERRLVGPDGEPIKVVQDPFGGVQVEHGEHLHAVIRPPTVTKGAKPQEI